MIEFFTQLVALPMWAILVLGLFAVVGAVFIPMAIVAWHRRETYTEKGMQQMDYKQQQLDEKENAILLAIEKQKEEERRFAQAQKEYEDKKADYLDERKKCEEERTACERERNELEKANTQRNNLLKSLTTQRKKIEQERKKTEEIRKEAIVAAQKQEVQATLAERARQAAELAVKTLERLKAKEVTEPIETSKETPKESPEKAATTNKK